MDKYNKSGCLDMTAYLALRNIERGEAVTNRKVSKTDKLSVKQTGSVGRIFPADVRKHKL